MSKYMGTAEWNPSEWYLYKASPVQKLRIKHHIEGHHTDECIVYDVNYHGTYCKYLDNVFWPRVFFNNAIKQLTEVNSNDL